MQITSSRRSRATEGKPEDVPLPKIVEGRIGAFYEARSPCSSRTSAKDNKLSVAKVAIERMV